MSINGVKIVLVEPAGPLNVGSVARVMKNFGLDKLVLVNPQCDFLGAEALQMAVHGRDVLESAVTVDTLPSALQGCIRAIATTARNRVWETPLETPRQTLPWLLEARQPSALIFGRENRGLSNEELNHAQKFVRIPTNKDYSSLNLATSVGICCYELSQSQDMGIYENINKTEAAAIDVVEGYYQQLESLLLKIGYLFPHTAASRMEKLRQMYNRSELTAQEVAMLRGTLRQLEWAIEQHHDGEKL